MRKPIERADLQALGLSQVEDMTPVFKFPGHDTSL